MKRLAMLALAFWIPAVSSGADWGLGVSLDHSPSIFVPINLSEGFRLEPFINLIDDDSELGGGVRGQLEAKELGLGLFGRRALDDKAGAYYGVRYALLKGDTKVTDSTGGVLFESEDDGDEFNLVIGGEYALASRLFVGLEAYWYRVSVDTTEPGETNTQTTTGTDAQVILRFMF